MILEILIGVIVAGIAVWLGRRFFPEKDHHYWRIGLVLAPCVYIVFALIHKNWEWFPIELIGVAIYGLLAWLSIRNSLIWLGVGWLLHGGWDIFLHYEGYPGYIMPWYPGLCFGFDLIVGIYIFWRWFKMMEMEV